jgi:hypothetical protein
LLSHPNGSEAPADWSITCDTGRRNIPGRRSPAPIVLPKPTDAKQISASAEAADAVEASADSRVADGPEPVRKAGATGVGSANTSEPTSISTEQGQQ